MNLDAMYRLVGAVVKKAIDDACPWRFKSLSKVKRLLPMSLDPCGKYHHMLSPNGMRVKCERFWDALDEVADKLGGWIEAGEGDPTDIFYCEQAIMPDLHEEDRDELQA